MFKNLLKAFVLAISLRAVIAAPNVGIKARQSAPPSTVGTWQYKGCYQDSSERILTYVFDAPVNTIESCTALCASKGYGLAGLQYGRECWCDRYMPSGSLKPDSECSTPCAGDPTQFCGGGNRMTLYEDSAGPYPVRFECIDWRDGFALGNILEAVPKSGGKARRLYTAPTNPTTDPTVYSVLSVCPEDAPCPYTGRDQFKLSFGVVLNGPAQQAKPVWPNWGDSQTWVENGSEYPWRWYCARANPLSTSRFIGKPILEDQGSIIAPWALCPNITADGRVDVVLGPKEGHNHYHLEACEEVWVQFSTTVNPLTVF
ncbi:WSC domain-containing protein [Coprinopsis sp. MPI-PUGE-AT-0042]|nr:WSC domain-containing protein [Coprinopsis sp. MPI-PUGE-AT-0042]